MDPPLYPPALHAGSVLAGRYRLDRRIASGGMASVWEAHDEVLARAVAVKVLHAHLGADEQFVARFKREAVAAARLAHPSIVAIYDTCSQDAAASDGGPYPNVQAIVMELVRGTTLRAELDRRGRFPAVEAAHVVAEVADALACAHAAGIVHRDVKPANVLLSNDGRVLVADFGIAKAGDGLDLTGTDTTLGTAKYLAPEQVDASLGPVDARADVYAAGVILYELLCGRPPFTADTEVGTALARLHRDATRPREILPDLDPAMESVVLRAMARQPAGRFPSALELRNALRAAVLGVVPAGGPPTAAVPTVPAVDPTGIVPVDGTRIVAAPPPLPSPPRRQPRRWAPVVLGSIVVAALAVAAVLWAGTGDGDGDGSSGGDRTPAVDGGLRVAGVRSFDPEGDDGLENDEDAPRVIDTDPATIWRTSCYSRSDFGGLKDGVGLIVDLIGPATLDELRVDSPNAGWSADVYVADEAGGELAAWGAPVTSQVGVTGTTTFELGGAQGQHLLLWFTGLGDTASPDCRERPFGVSVSELAVV